MVPAETLVFLETNDLAAALQPMVASEAFKKTAASQPDLSAVKGVSVAVAVTGFETSEQKLTEEDSVGRVQPKFVAIIDTRAWNYQAVAFVQNQVVRFVGERFGEAKGGRNQKSQVTGGDWFTWVGNERHEIAHALVLDGIVFFGNDESAIDKCLAVRKGESDSIAKSGKLPQRVPGSLASGYISTDGVAQIAALAGMSFASQSSDDEEVQSAVAGLLPQLIRGTVTDVAWNTSQSQQGYEDKVTFGVNAETAPVLSEVFAPTASINADLFGYTWGKALSITLYNLEKPNVAWRGLLLTARTKVDGFGSRVIGEFSNAFAEPYGVADAELFLSAIGTNIVSLRTDTEGEKPALIASITNIEAVRRSLSKDLKPVPNAAFETLKDEDSTAIFAGNILIIGDSEAVDACLQSKAAGTSLAASPSLVGLFRPNNSAVTIAMENDQAAPIADLLSEKNENANSPTIAITETRFTKTAIERRTTSDLGLIGWLLSKLNEE